MVLNSAKSTFLHLNKAFWYNLDMSLDELGSAGTTEEQAIDLADISAPEIADISQIIPAFNEAANEEIETKPTLQAKVTTPAAKQKQPQKSSNSGFLMMAWFTAQQNDNTFEQSNLDQPNDSVTHTFETARLGGSVYGGTTALGITNLTEFDNISSFVIKGLEGGDQIAREPGGAIAKYGVNSLAHPEVDVRNLTREEAYEIAKNDYWDAIDADSLPENMRLVAFDTAYNHGVSKAQKLITQADGDPQKLLSLREQEYNRLVQVNPEKYGQYLNGWKQRLANLDNQFTINENTYASNDPDINTVNYSELNPMS